jgi:hypothetical protein
MQIQFRQGEIVEALKQYITKQGINLQGKQVEISFTAGRKESGLSADVSIEEMNDLPDLAPDVVTPTLSVVPAGPIPSPIDAAPTVEEPAPTTAPEPAKPSSLFG